jgi:hypothetical protein
MTDIGNLSVSPDLFLEVHEFMEPRVKIVNQQVNRSMVGLFQDPGLKICPLRTPVLSPNDNNMGTSVSNRVGKFTIFKGTSKISFGKSKKGFHEMKILVKLRIVKIRQNIRIPPPLAPPTKGDEGRD